MGKVYSTINACLKLITEPSNVFGQVIHQELQVHRPLFFRICLLYKFHFPHEGEHNALSYICQFGSLRDLDLLIRLGVNLNQICPSKAIPLFHALESLISPFEKADLLMTAGADINQSFDTLNLITYFVARNQPDTIEYLIKQGALLKNGVPDGPSLVKVAKLMSRTYSLETLLAHGMKDESVDFDDLEAGGFINQSHPIANVLREIKLAFKSLSIIPTNIKFCQGDELPQQSLKVEFLVTYEFKWNGHDSKLSFMPVEDLQFSLQLFYKKLIDLTVPLNKGKSLKESLRQALQEPRARPREVKPLAPENPTFRSFCVFVGIKYTNDRELLKDAYRNYVKTNHPDVKEKESLTARLEAEENMKKVNSLYESVDDYFQAA